MNNFHDKVMRQIGIQEGGRDKCLLCGSQNVTREHVIPKWLQKANGLASQKFTRPNGTKSIYSRLVVPLCVSCNGVYFGGLEGRVSISIINENWSSKLNPLDLQLWVTKIYYFLQMFEKLNPVYDPELGLKSNLSDDDIKSLHLLHLTLRKVISEQQILFPNKDVASVWVFECSDDWPENEFAFGSSSGQNIVALKVEKRLVFAVVGDWGQYKLGAQLDSLTGPLSQNDFLYIFIFLKYLVAKNGISKSFAFMGDSEDGELQLLPIVVDAKDMDFEINQDFEEFYLTKMEEFSQALGW